VDSVGVSQSAPPVRRIVRVDERGRVEPFGAEPVAASGDAWSHLTLEEYVRAPGEERAATLVHHMVVLNLGSGYRRELQWGDDPTVLRYTFQPGSITLFPAGTRFRVRWLDDAHALAVSVDPSLLREVQGSKCRAHPGLVRVAEVSDPLLAHLMHGLREVLRMSRESQGVYGAPLGHALATHLLAHYGSSKTLATGGALPLSRLRRIAEHIDRNLDAPLSLQELSALAGLSVFHFARTFKERTGLSPHQYVLRRRVERAKELLSTSRASLAEIALRCGFSHQSHFTRAFHLLSGMTPTRWREGSPHIEH
jgi:AraC family transcriptional regulator